MPVPDRSNRGTQLDRIHNASPPLPLRERAGGEGWQRTAAVKGFKHQKLWIPAKDLRE